MKYIFTIALVISNVAFADNYLGLPALIIPADNPQTIEKTALGQLLFNEQRFSGDGTISCASCHQKDKAFTDGLKVAQGINQQKGTRNTPTIVNAAFFDRFFLDGRTQSLELQALGPFINTIEHGLENHKKIVDIIRTDTDYKKSFQRIFKLSPDEITIEHVAKAIAGYERTLIAGNSAFDQYYFGRDRTKLSASAARGLLVFRRKGNCANCHEISLNNALFTDNRFYNIGIGIDHIQPILDDLLTLLKQGKDPDQLPLTTQQRSELGRFNVTKQVNDIGKFKTPTLRNIALTAPYMHNGSLQSLAEVIEYYDRGGNQSSYTDPATFPLHLTQQEKTDLLAFLNVLTSGTFDKK